MIMIWFLRNWKLIALGTMALALAGLVFAHYERVKTLEQDNLNLTSELSQARLSIQVQDATINTQREALAEWSEFRSNMTQQLQELADGQAIAREERQRLSKIFGEHDFERLLNARPDLVLDRVNNGSARIGRLLECASGATGPDCDDGPGRETLAPSITETGTD